MSYDAITPDEPTDENEAFENLDEALDDQDALGGGPEGGRDLDTDLIVDDAELESIGANLDDPDDLAPQLSGGMDDPDGPDPDDPPGLGGTGGEVVDTAVPRSEDDPTSIEDLEGIADDAPGVDSARW